MESSSSGRSSLTVDGSPTCIDPESLLAASEEGGSSYG